MVTKQERTTARALLEAEHRMPGYIKSTFGPQYLPNHTPTRPLTQREVVHALRNAAGRDVAASTVPFLPKEHKGGGFKLTPAAIISDIPKELEGGGAVEKGLLALGTASAKGWEHVPGVGKFLGRASKDAYGIAATAVPSIYLPAKALAQGHPGKAGKMLGAPILETLEHPVKSFKEHPIGTLLILRGAEGALSRAAGATARSEVLGDAAARAASLERLPLHLAGSALEQRRYSKGLFENIAQKGLDRRALEQGRGTVVKMPVRDAEGKLLYNAKVEAIRATSRQLHGPGLPLAGKLGRRVDTEHGKHVETARLNRNAALLVMDKAKPNAHEAVALINEGVLKSPKSVLPDLMDHLAQLRRERERLSQPADLEHNAENIRQVESLLKDQKFLENPQHEFDAARIYALAHLAQESSRIHYGDFTAEQATRRVLLPFAIRELGLRFNEDTGRFERTVTVPAHAAQQIDRATAQLKDQLERARQYARPERIQQLEDQLAEATMKAAKQAVETARTNAHGTVELGLPVPDKEIVDAFKAAGGDPELLAYVPQRQGFTGPRNFWGPQHRRPGAASHRFHGTNTLSGAYERSYEVLRQQLANAAMRVSRHESVNDLINTFGLKRSDGQYFGSLREAEQEAHNQLAKSDVTYVPITVARQTAPHTLLDQLSPAELEHTFTEAGPGDSHIVLMPADVLHRIEAHERVKPYGNPLFTAFTTMNRYFRHSVLPTSSKWLAGDAFEAFLRMQINELTPLQVAATIRAGRKLEARVKKLGGEKAVQNIRAAAGSGQFGSQRVLDIHNPHEGAIVQFLHAFAQSGIGPGHMIGPKAITRLWESYRDAVFAFNRTITEGSVYYYALGKEARAEVQAMTGSWLKALRLAGPAYEDVARGLTQSNNIARYAKRVDEIRGRYTNLSPSARWATTMLTPFAPWYGNAIYFLTITLPARHPVKTALLAAANQGTAKERKRLMKNRPPWASTSVPVGKRGYLPVEHLTPFGIFEGGKLGENAAQLVLPQAEGVILNELGDTWFGAPLPKGTDRQAVALETALETFVPFASKARTVLERGGTSVPGSSVFRPETKPTPGQLAYWREKTGNPKLTSEQAAKLARPHGSLLAGLEKALSPGHVYNVKSHRKRGRKGTSGASFGTNLSFGSLGNSKGAGSFGGNMTP
jgi:hypothetical protein